MLGRWLREQFDRLFTGREAGHLAARRFCAVHVDGPCWAVPWDRELDMVPGVISGLHLLTPGPGWELFQEVDGPRGVADLVLVRFDARVIQERDRLGLSPVLDWSGIRSLAALSQAESLDALPGHVGVSRRHLLGRVLPRLTEVGWLSKDENGWTPVLNYRSPAAAVVTVELKRDDWRGALRQAAWHARSADASWVVLDRAKVRPALNASDAFAHAGVGVASVARWPVGCAGLGETVQAELLPTPPGVIDPVGRAFFAEQCAALRAAGLSSGPDRLVFGRRLAATDT